MCLLIGLQTTKRPSLPTFPSQFAQSPNLLITFNFFLLFFPFLHTTHSLWSPSVAFFFLPFTQVPLSLSLSPRPRAPNPSKYALSLSLQLSLLLSFTFSTEKNLKKRLFHSHKKTYKTFFKKRKKNLASVWFQYPDTKLSNPNTISVCFQKYSNTTIRIPS